MVNDGNNLWLCSIMTDASLYKYTIVIACILVIL